MMKNTLEDISKSITSKRCSELDSNNFSVSKIQRREHDIRNGNRDIDKLAENLRINGQLHPLDVNLREDGKTVPIDGTTRLFAFPLANINKCSVRFYKHLTIMEEDYFDVNANSEQKTLDPDEKANYVKLYLKEFKERFGDKFIEQFCDLLKIQVPRMKEYIVTSSYSVDTRKKFHTSKGGGRGETNWRAFADTVKIVNKFTDKTQEEKENLVQLLGEERQERRKKADKGMDRIIGFESKKIARRVVDLEKNEDVTGKYSIKEIVNIASKEVKLKYASGEKLPKNSENKYPIINRILRENNFEFSLVLCSEGLTRRYGPKTLGSETKRIIDSGIKHLIVNGLEIDKIIEIENYAKLNGCEVTVYCPEHIMVTIEKLSLDNRRGLIFINGAFLYTQRPKLMQTLKAIYPNSMIVFVMLDEFTGKRGVPNTEMHKELITVYGIQKLSYFQQILNSFKEQIPQYNCKFEKYADLPQAKYIGIVE